MCVCVCVCVFQEQVEVTQVDNALRFQTEEPHLVSMGSGRLSTAVTIHPLPVGQCHALGVFWPWPQWSRCRLNHAVIAMDIFSSGPVRYDNYL